MYLNEIYVVLIKRYINMILFVKDKKNIIWNMLYCLFGGNIFCKFFFFKNDIVVFFFYFVLRL